MKRIHVVAAVIHGEGSGKPADILISKRPDHLHQGGKWEFPGGKVEPDEAVEAALKRELKEELDIEARAYRPLIQIQYDYPDKSVFLDVWDVLGFSGTPKGMEGQQVEWVSVSRLAQYEFPAANVPIVQAVKLPDRYWITPDIEGSLSEFIQVVEEKLSAGIRLVQLRTKSLNADKLVALCEALMPLKLRFQFSMLINGDCQDVLRAADRWRDVFSLFDGMHLTASQLPKGRDMLEGLPSLKLLSASCHNDREIEMAESLGCSFITLSPVKVTKSHRDAEPLSPDTLSLWVRKAKVPVYALGGMSDSDIEDVKEQGFQGVAGIRKVAMKKGDAELASPSEDID